MTNAHIFQQYSPLAQTESPIIEPISKTPTIPRADLDTGRGRLTPAPDVDVEVAVDPLDVPEAVESAPVVVAPRVTTPVPVAVAVAVAVALAFVLHQNSPAPTALIRHSARVPTVWP
jgi:hypothetical protein